MATSTTARAGACVAGFRLLAEERLARERHAGRVSRRDVREVPLVIRRANDESDRAKERGEASAHQPTPSMGARGWNGASVESAGFRSPITAHHSRDESTRMTTT